MAWETLVNRWFSFYFLLFIKLFYCSFISIKSYYCPLCILLSLSLFILMFVLYLCPAYYPSLCTIFTFCALSSFCILSSFRVISTFYVIYSYLGFSPKLYPKLHVQNPPNTHLWHFMIKCPS